MGKSFVSIKGKEKNELEGDFGSKIDPKSLSFL